MLYNIYYIYNYYYYIYYIGTCYYGLRVTYDTYYTLNYIYNLIPNINNYEEDKEVNVELYEIEYKNDWNILKIYK